jgi:plasmid maintenance system antidote protein VapI
MESLSAQQSFFQHIKSILPSHLSLIDEIADVLSITNDSVYRRVRGEKPITLDEAAKLASHFKISLDQFLHLQSDSFIFSGKLANESGHVFEKWMQETLKQLAYVNSFKHKHMYYLAKDLPLPFMVRELTAFKSFFWRKSILHYHEMKGAKFSLKNIDEQHILLGKKIIETYNQIPSSEIWHIESINSTIRQIEFYRDAGIFETEEDIRQLYKAVLQLINHLELQADLGLKFNIGEKPLSNAARYNLYNNELILGDNTVLAELDEMKITFLNHSVINYVVTRDVQFNVHMYDNIQNLIRKSTHLSEVGEKERARFFNRIRDKIKQADRL